MPIYRGDGGSGDASTDAYASQVAQNAQTATTKANEAAASATAAAGSATSAASSATTATSQASAASTSASNASTSETNAGTSETNAATSATNAASSATAAASSATNAATQATSATSQASAASTSATNAAASEANASTSETNAASSATTATTQASAASTSATNAATSATAAAASATAAEAAKDAIDGLYLGAQASNPTVDGNGDAVTAGDWYFNTSDNSTRIYDGSAWNTINPDLVGDSTPQLGGTLDANGNTIDMGTNVITDAKVGQWDTAYGWGDHSTQGYLTSFTETNDLTAAVTWANVPDANITQSSVTQHQAALSITESQISDLQSYLTAESDTLDSVTGRGASTTNSLTVGGLHVDSTTAVELPTGTEAQRPTAVAGMFRFNTDSSSFEGYSGTAWGSVGFPSGTSMLFAQTTAPTGWTKSTTHNDKALRVVSGTAGSGGSIAFTTAFGSQNVGATTLSISEMPSHSHDQYLTNYSASQVNTSARQPRQLAYQFTGSTLHTGGGGSHTHSLDLSVNYVDVIIATKD